MGKVDESAELAETSRWSDSINAGSSLLADAELKAEDLKDLLGPEVFARQAFDRLWLLCLTSEQDFSASAERVRVCEVLQHTARLHGPKRSVEVGRQLAMTFGGSTLPVSREEAFALARSALKSMQEKLESP